MEESKEIKLNLGDTTLNETLGIYYIDMRPSIIHYTENIYNGGIDADGVPFLRNERNQKYYSPVNIAQYAFIIHAQNLEKENLENLRILKNCVEKLESIKTEKDDYIVWLHNEHNKKYDIKPPYASAMAQGQVISFYLRYFQLTNDKYYLNQAYKAFKFLKIDYERGGVRRYDEDGYLWLEEYPSVNPSYVLNGFIYCLFGLFDLYRITKDEEINNEIKNCLFTLRNNLIHFDTGYWTRYDLFKKELVRYYYQKNVHVPQIKVLYELTKDKYYLDLSKKWNSYLTPLNFILVKIMYRIQPRFSRLTHLIYSLKK